MFFAKGVIDMEKYGVFEINTKSVSNLNYIATDESRGFELRLCEMSFMADNIARQFVSLVSEGMSNSEAFSLLAEDIDFAVGEADRDTILETQKGVEAFMKMLSATDKASFSILLVEKLAEAGINVSEKDFLPESDPQERFIYVKNSLADEAFDVFSQEFSDPRITYAESFKEACSGVAEKKYGYCILPFEEKSSVRIPSIFKLVSGLDLKIVAITPVFGFEGNADMKYALIGRDFKIPDRSESTDRYFEISIPKDTAKLSEIFIAVEMFGLEVYKMGMTFAGDGGEKASYSIIFKDGGRSFTELIVYLSLFAEEYIPVGIYKNIE